MSGSARAGPAHCVTTGHPLNPQGSFRHSVPPTQRTGCRNRECFGLRSDRCTNPARMRPTHEDQGGPVTTNKHTPKISGSAAADADAFSDDDVPADGPDGAAGRSGAQLPEEGASVA